MHDVNIQYCCYWSFLFFLTINHQDEQAMYICTLQNESFTVAIANTSKRVDGYAENNEILPVWEITRAQKCEWACRVRDDQKVPRKNYLCCKVNSPLERLGIMAFAASSILCKQGVNASATGSHVFCLDEHVFLMVVCSDCVWFSLAKNVSSLFVTLFCRWELCEIAFCLTSTSFLRSLPVATLN